MSPGSKPTSFAAPAGGSALAAALVWQGDGEPRAYLAFETVIATVGGFFLGGPLFLEVDEEVTIEFRLADGAVRARARVIAVRRDDQPGMIIVLVDTDDATTARITAAAGTSS